MQLLSEIGFRAYIAISYQTMPLILEHLQDYFGRSTLSKLSVCFGIRPDNESLAFRIYSLHT